MHDELEDKVYTLFDHKKGKILRQINMLDGTLGAPALIDCNLVEKVKVNGGVVFYLESGSDLAGYNRVLRTIDLQCVNDRMSE